MRLQDWWQARWIQATAPWTARYGEALRFAGSDIPPPERVRVPTRHGPVGVEVYRPPGLPDPAPVHVHAHGGAFIMRHPHMDDWWCRYLAAEAGVVVWNIDFHVAPQVAYPVSHEECHDVLAHAWAEADRLGLDRDRLTVGGFSSGANLAASACLQARDLDSCRPALQVLGVPALDLTTAPRDGEPGLVAPGLRRLVRRVYFPDAARRYEPYASPLLAPDLSGLPPAMMLTAEHDVLRHDGERYAQRLVDSGVRVAYDQTPGVDHYFLTEDPVRARTTMAVMAAQVAAAAFSRDA